MSRKLWITDVELVTVPSIHKYDRQLVVWCLDEHGHNTAVLVEDFQPWLDVFPVDSAAGTDSSSLNAAIEEMNESKDAWKREVTHGEVRQMTPLVGFTNNRKDNVWRLYMVNESARWRLSKSLEEDKALLGRDHVIKCVLHDKFKGAQQFLFSTGLRRHTWIEVSNKQLNKVETGAFTCPAFRVRSYERLSTITENVPIDPVRQHVTVRVVAKSSTATLTTPFAASADIKSDEVQAIVVTFSKAEGKRETLALQGHDEASTIQRFNDFLRDNTNTVNILQICSDDGHDLEYLVRRSMLSMIPLNMSMVKGHVNKLVEFEGRLLDVTTPGLDVIDVGAILRRYMCSPPLDGFDLYSALSHPKLVKNKTPFEEILNDVRITPMSSLEDRVRRARLQVELIDTLAVDQSFLAMNVALSRACEASLTHIISRGQQAKVRGVFFRRYTTDDIYVNHWEFEKQYCIVKMPRSKSSFPFPEWLKNPSLASLTQPPQPSNKKRKAFGRVNNKKTKRKKAKKQHQWWKPKTVSANAMKKSTKGFSGGFVIPPLPGFYWQLVHAVTTLDWASLYPSVIQGFRICYMRVCYDKKWIDDPRATKQYVPLDDDTCAVFITHYDGVPVRTVTDEEVANVTNNRKRFRAQMKTTTDKNVLDALNAAQLSAKVIQNSAYGFLGSTTSGMLCSALAAAVTNISVHMNKTGRYIALKNGARCVGGDTDSIQIQVPTWREGDDPNVKLSNRQIFTRITEKCDAIAKEVSALFPHPNDYETEVVKTPCLITDKKKVYCCKEIPPFVNKAFTTANSDELIDGYMCVKGMGYKKREKCRKAFQAGQAAQDFVFTNPESEIEKTKTYLADLDKHCASIRPRPKDVSDYVITVAINADLKSDTVVSATLIKMITADTGVPPVVGRRVPYVMCEVDTDSSEDDKKRYECAVPLGMYVNDTTRRLDVPFYLEKQLLPCLKQILSLPQHADVLTAATSIVMKHVEIARNNNVSCVHVNKKRRMI
jgi:DNA polymerase elongation subunit (family B)